MPFGPTYDANFKCQYVWKDAVLNKNICHFWDRHRARFPEKNSKTWEYIQIDAILRSGFFFRKTRSVMVPRFGFFPGFTDKG